MRSSHITLLILSLILNLASLSHGFINCPAGGYKLCSSTDIAYVMTGINNLNVSDCVYENCPQIIITNSAGIAFSNVTFRKGNYSANSLGMGGAVLIRGSKCTFKQVLFDRVAFVNQGSAMYVFNSSVILDNCTFYGNRASDQGGAVMLYRAQAFNCTRCNFISNRAPYGGAVSVLNDNYNNLTFAYFINSLFDGNQAISINGTANGGAISAFAYAKVYLSNTNIINGFSDYKGAGFYLIGRANVYVEYLYCINLTTISGHFMNSVGSAGYNTAVIRNSVFDHIGGGVHGGVFRINQGATYLKVDNSKFYSSNSDGGSVVYGDSLNISVPLYFTNCSFYDDVTLGGGVLHGRYSCTFMVDRCNFYNAFGGELGAAIVLHDSATVSRITNSGFYNCRSVILGGAIVCEAGDIVIDNCIFDSCSSVNGGAIYVETGSGKQLTISNSVFSNNKGRIGGDIYVYAAIRATISNNLFYNSSALTGGSIASTIPLVMSNNTFYNVSAIQFGGAVYASQTTASISDCRVFNSSAGSGGAIFLDRVTLTMQRVNFTGCSSKRSGGVLYLSQGTASMIVVISFGTSTNVGGFITAQYQTLNMISVLVYSTSSIEQGGIIFSAGSNIVLQGCEFDYPSSNSGGSFYLAFSSALTATNVKVIGSQAVFGAAFYLDSTSSASCVGSTFLNIVSNSNGSLAYVTSGSSFSLIDSLYQNDVPETTTGCLFYLQGGQLFVQNFEYDYGSSLTGTLVNAIEGSTGSFQQVTVSYVTATEKGASIVIADGLTTLQFTNCKFISPRADKLFLATGASQITFRSTSHAFNSTPSTNLPVWSQQFNQILFQSDSGSTIALSDSSQVLDFTGDTTCMVNALSTFSCVDSEITGSVLQHSPIYGGKGSSVVLSSCYVSSNLVTGAVDTCNVQSGVIGFGGAVASSGSVIISGSSEITGNMADYGGAIYMSEPGTLSIEYGTLIWNNTASTYGGAFYIDTTGSCQMENENVNVSSNIATAYPSSNFALFKNGYLQFNSSSLSLGSVFAGGILVQNHSTADALSTSSLVPVAMKLEGKAKVLTLINFKNGSSIELTVNSDIPPIQIGALDGFGRLAIVDASNLVIINAQEVAQGVGLKGETIKTIFDPVNRTTTLYSLSIPNRTPGYYTLKFSAKPGILDNSDLPDMPLILNVQYRLCDPNSELFVQSENVCIPLVMISRYIRVAITVICLILIFGCLATLYGLRKYRDYSLIKANSYVFLSIPVVGCILAFLAPILASVSCIVSTAFENIGFCLIFTSLLIKLYRIRVLFVGDIIVRRETIKNLQESHLLLYLLLAVVLFSVYEVLWGVFANPQPVPTFIPTLGIVIADKCNTESFPSFGMAAIKFVISVIVSYLAFVNRNVPSEFNEAKYIGYSCYNWVIFGTFIGLTAQYLITNPDIGFVVKSMSLVLSHACTTLYLATYKVYKCMKDKDMKNGKRSSVAVGNNYIKSKSSGGGNTNQNAQISEVPSMSKFSK